VRILIKKLNIKKYQQLVKRTAKGSYKRKSDEIVNWGLGVSGEAGDLAGCIKKTIFHNNDQTQGVRENVGDTMWYLAMICNYYDWDFEEVLAENIEKLSKRYSKGFSAKEAARGGTRIDWNEK
jgi:NTP pyrophosphatase (non-canonical NTP hydrolase)